MQIAWKDSSIVLFLSTVHGGAESDRTPKKRKFPAKKATKAESQRLRELFGYKAHKVISIPSVAAQYNNEMNHVDRGDQLRSYTTYEHRFRRGPWQALLWGFLLDVTLVNTYILQLKTPNPLWKPYATLKEWKECIYNAIFNQYATESQARKRNRSGAEEDTEDTETRQNHLQRDINHVRRGANSACLACKGFRQGQARPFKRRKANGSHLQPISGNKRLIRTRWGCKVCDVAICNNENCWYLYHSQI
jgi:hypothetical protein